MQNNKKILDKDKIDVVIYHGYPCLDGFGSAMIVWLYYKEKFGIDSVKSMKFLGGSYESKEIMPDFKGKNVIMLDFSLKKAELMALIEKVNSFMILDHHTTAQIELTDVPDELKIFDMNRSGVGITWDYFFPGGPMPLLFEYIQDRDLWTKKMPLVDVFTLMANMTERKYEVFELFLNEEYLNQQIEKGKYYFEYQEHMIENIVNHATFNIVDINGTYCVVGYCNTGSFMSDVGNKIFSKYSFADFSCVYYYNNQIDETKISLRSTGTRMDVSAIAASFGGGGHRNASGCSFKGMNLFPYPIVDRVGELLYSIHNNIAAGKTNVINGKNILICRIKSSSSLSMLKDPKFRNLLQRKFPTLDWIVPEWLSNGVCYRHMYRNATSFYDPVIDDFNTIQTELQKLGL